MKNNILKNVVMVMSSNIILLVLGILMSFAIPIFLNVENYGYWQLYLYYSGFVGFFMLGFNDGMNIRFAGRNIDKLPGSLFKFFFKVVIFLSVFFSILGLIIIYLSPIDDNAMYVFLAVTINILIFNIHGFCTHINQMTSRFKYYSISNIVERALFVLTFPILIVFSANFKIVILINLVCRFIAVLYNIFSIKELLIDKSSTLLEFNYIQEVKLNFISGLPLMLATIFSMVMTTVPRLVVERLFSIQEYGYFSFGYSTLNLAIQLIVAMSAVFFPTLKRIDASRHLTVYNNTKEITMSITIISLLTYYPVYVLVNIFYPQYSIVLGYLYTLFPVIIFQVFNSLITANFSRLQRLEKKYLHNNFVFFIVNFVLTYLIGINTHNILYIMITSLFVMLAWIYFSDLYIEKSFSRTNIEKSNFILLTISIIYFILINYLLRFEISFVLYLLYILILMFIKRDMLRKLKSFIQK